MYGKDRFKLPMLADGFEQQKGHIFEFGKDRVDILPQQKLECVPVNNIAEETSSYTPNFNFTLPTDLCFCNHSQKENADVIDKCPST